jgi:hypothetical protein
MPRVYHLGVSEREIAGAPLALLPGDPPESRRSLPHAPSRMGALWHPIGSFIRGWALSEILPS